MEEGGGVEFEQLLDAIYTLARHLAHMWIAANKPPPLWLSWHLNNSIVHVHLRDIPHMWMANVSHGKLRFSISFGQSWHLYNSCTIQSIQYIHMCMLHIWQVWMHWSNICAKCNDLTLGKCQALNNQFPFIISFVTIPPPDNGSIQLSHKELQ